MNFMQKQVMDAVDSLLIVTIVCFLVFALWVHVLSVHTIPVESVRPVYQYFSVKLILLSLVRSILTKKWKVK